MSSVQPLNRRPNCVPRNVTLLCFLLAIASGCADRAQQANNDGAVAEQQLSAGDLAGAKRTINKAIAERDDIVSLQLLKGRISIAQGSSDDAFAAYSAALSLDPSNQEALQGVSRLGLTTNHLDESLEATDRILLLDPNQPDAILTRGIHSLVRHRFDEALTYADKLLAVSPASEDGRILKARALFLKGEPQKALETIDERPTSGSESTAVALTKLELFRELHQAPGMQAEFAKLETLLPADLSLRLDEANLRFKLGDRAGAHSLVAKVLGAPAVTEDLADQAVQLWVNYGYDGLSSDNLRTIKTGGTRYSRELAARFLVESSRLPQAEELLSSVSGPDRQALEARLRTARSDYPGAIALADEVLNRDKTQCDALVAKSLASDALKLWDTGLTAAQRAASECPEQVAPWLANARAYDGLERTSGAERVYWQALSAYPQDIRVVRSYSEWLLAHKRSREALATARRLTASAPGLLIGWEYYGDLCRRTASDCQNEARDGLKTAKTLLGVDLPIGTRAPNSLFGRFVRR